MLEYLELYYVKYKNKNTNKIEDCEELEVVDREKYYRHLCSSIPNIFIADGLYWQMSELKIQERNEYKSKLPIDYKIHLTQF